MPFDSFKLRIKDIFNKGFKTSFEISKLLFTDKGTSLRIFHKKFQGFFPHLLYYINWQLSRKAHNSAEIQNQQRFF